MRCSFFLEASDIIDDSGDSGFNFPFGSRVLFFRFKNFAPVWHIAAALMPFRLAATIDHYMNFFKGKFATILLT